MTRSLGANFDLGPDFAPWFPHPSTKKSIYVFPDPCHMVKNVRNAFAEKGPFIDGEGRIISWKYIKKLLELQETMKLTFGNKLGKLHVDFKNVKMKVKLATQVLSDSVGDSLLYLKSIGKPGFEDCEGTAIFCKTMNNIFDILNCRSRYTKKPFEIPVTNENEPFLRESATNYIEYIKQLKCADTLGAVVDSQRKNGFVGFIICLQNLLPLFQQIKNVENFDFDYLISYKLCQDHIENLFGAIRGHSYSNNNPNALIFKSSYKRMLIRHQIESSVKGNCERNDVEILDVASSFKKKKNNSASTSQQEEWLPDPELYVVYESDSEIVETFQEPTELESEVEDICSYIAGSNISNE